MNYAIGTWIKNVYSTTLSEYKEVLNLWYKGTGGGSGLLDKFETWPEEKLEKHGIDISEYDHTNVTDRPAIMMDGYVKKKRYLTVIFMWDKVQGQVLAAKFNPLSLGLGEAGYRDEIDDASTLSSMDRSKTSLSKSSKSSVRTEDKMASMVTSVINGVLRSQDDGHRGSGKI